MKNLRLTQQSYLLESDYDIVIRMGELDDSNLIASTLKTVTTRYVASKEFVDVYGDIDSPEQLQKLPLIYGSVKQWILRSKNNKHTINIHKGTHANNGRVMRHAALLGLGVTRLVDIYVESDIQKGTLIDVLSEYAQDTPLSVVSLPSKYQLKRIKELISYLKVNFSKQYSKVASEFN